MITPRPSLVGYFASISAVDEGVGQILNALDRAGVAERTCVIFTSDNGFNCGHHGVWGKGNATWPLNMWDTSVRIPFLIKVPGLTRPGTTFEELASACDVHPTILDIAGLRESQHRGRAAGSSLLPTLAGSPDRRERPVVIYDEYGGTRMIRTPHWKLIRRYEGPNELFDMASDPDETNNIVDDELYTDVIMELDNWLLQWFRTHADPEMDAFNKPVSGRGQLRPVGGHSADVPIYYDASTERRPLAPS